MAVKPLYHFVDKGEDSLNKLLLETKPGSIALRRNQSNRVLKGVEVGLHINRKPSGFELDKKNKSTLRMCT